MLKSSRILEDIGRLVSKGKDNAESSRDARIERINEILDKAERMTSPALIKKRIKEAENNIEVIGSEIAGLPALIKEVKSLKSSRNESLDSRTTLINDIEAIKKAQSESIANLMTLVGKLKDLENETSEQKKSIESIRAFENASKLEGVKKRIKENETKIESIGSEIAELSSFAKEIESLKALSKDVESVKPLAKEIESIKNTQSESIDNQMSLVGKLEEFEKKMSEQNEKIEHFGNEISEQKKAVGAVHASLENLPKRDDGVKKQIEEIESNINSIRSEMAGVAPLVKGAESIKALVNEIESIKNTQNESIDNQMSIIEKMEAFESDAREKSKKIGLLENEINGQRKTVDALRYPENTSKQEELKKRIKENETKIESIGSEIAELSSFAKEIESLKALSKDVESVKPLAKEIESIKKAQSDSIANLMTLVGKLKDLENETSEQKKSIESIRASEGASKLEGVKKRIKETENNINGIRSEIAGLSSFAKEIESIKNTQSESIDNQMSLVGKLEEFEKKMSEQNEKIEHFGNEISEQKKAVGAVHDEIYEAVRLNGIPVDNSNSCNSERIASNDSLIDLRKTSIPEPAIGEEQDTALFDIHKDIDDAQEVKSTITKSNGRLDSIVGRLERVRAKINS